jgi:hypothetical protein
MSTKLIKKLNSDSGQYYAVDVPEGEYTPQQMTDRINAQAEQFVEKYQTYSMGPGDKAPIPGDKLKPTPAVVVKY